MGEPPLPPDLADAIGSGPVLIVGLGREGVSTYRFLRRRFPRLRFGLADRSPAGELDAGVLAAFQEDENVELLAGGGYLDHASQFTAVFRSPGVRPDLPEVAAAGRAGARLSSNTELFLAIRPGRIVGVTGTKGKSTTAAVIHAVLERGGLRSRLLGNIGVPPLSVFDHDDAGGETIFVMEMSSFQLATVSESPDVAVVQSVVPEHLDYHGSYGAYVDAKTNIARHQGPDGLVVHFAGDASARIAAASPGAKLAFGLDPAEGLSTFVVDGWVSTSAGGSNERVLPAADVPLLGRFNLVNVLPGVTLGRVLGIEPEAVAAAVRDFRPLEHRLEPVGEVGGVEFYDDSLATVPEAAAAALGAFPDRPVVLIAGGWDRGQDFTPLARAVREADVRTLVLFEPTGVRLLERVESEAGDAAPPAVFVESMPEAVEAAVQAAAPGGVVLLSPGSASFGRFRDYRDRGDRFKAEVRRRAEA